MVIQFYTLPFTWFQTQNLKYKGCNVKGKTMLSLLDRLDKSEILMFNRVDRRVARQSRWVD
jgi:hypothetical protein